jgi:hypothetical protein
MPRSGQRLAGKQSTFQKLSRKCILEKRNDFAEYFIDALIPMLEFLDCGAHLFGGHECENSAGRSWISVVPEMLNRKMTFSIFDIDRCSG